jgi:hypothetical protein
MKKFHSYYKTPVFAGPGRRFGILAGRIGVKKKGADRMTGALLLSGKDDFTELR